MKILISASAVLFSVMMISCGEKKAPTQDTTFTKVDSLTDYYLAIQDSMLQAWNMMTHDDNEKILAMHNLVHELMITNFTDKDILTSYEERLEQLKHLRYTQKSMANPDVVEEYDFASNSLVSELISLAESRTEFTYNTTLQKLADDIRSADQRVDSYREEYDIITLHYNRFLDQHNKFLKEIDPNQTFEKKPIFQMVSGE
ncbi:MAG: hypothetical protein ABI663_12375 [Chryseolinea sp.]